ncbi:hypothetical protein X801_02473, partial [Opisthorchis viverrini]
SWYSYNDTECFNLVDYGISDSEDTGFFRSVVEGPLVTDTTTQTVVTTDTETTSTSPSPGTQVTQETSTAGAGRIQTLRRDPNVPTAAPRNVPRIDTQSTQSTHYPLFRYGRIGRSPFRSPSRRKKHPLGSIHVASLGLG